MSEHSEQPKTNYLVSLVDPSAAFRHNMETERQKALAHEGFILTQMEALQNDLDSIRNVIAGCDAALASTVLIKQTEPGAPSAPAPGATGGEVNKDSLSIIGEKPDQGLPVPEFLLTPKSAA